MIVSGLSRISLQSIESGAWSYELITLSRYLNTEFDSLFVNDGEAHDLSSSLIEWKESLQAHPFVID